MFCLSLFTFCNFSFLHCSAQQLAWLLWTSVWLFLTLHFPKLTSSFVFLFLVAQSLISVPYVISLVSVITCKCLFVMCHSWRLFLKLFCTLQSFYFRLQKCIVKLHSNSLIYSYHLSLYLYKQKVRTKKDFFQQSVPVLL